MNTQEIECRFLEVNKSDLIKKLRQLGAVDKGEVLLQETIIYDKELEWPKQMRFVRLRKSGDSVKVTYKEHQSYTIDGTYEIEFGIDDYKKAELLFEKIGLNPHRHQQKYRHTFELNTVTVDIDTWPSIPVYVELEGNAEEDLKNVAQILGFDWEKADMHSAAWVIENVYKIPVRQLRKFTFDKIE